MYKRQGKDKDRFRSKYLDIPNAPLYPFGYGLSYTTFTVSEVSLDKDSMKDGESIRAAVTVKNTGTCAGTETIQLYLHDIAASVVRPVKELKDFRKVTLQPEEEARGLALSSELFINGSLNTFAQPTNVNKKNRIMDYDIRELGEQLMPLGMLVTLDSIFNRVIQNWKEGKTTWIFADEFYLLFRYEYSANFFYRLYKRIRKYNGFVTGLTQNVEELLKSDTARLMLANSEFLILLNQASTDREELAALLNISENQLSYITNVSVGSGLIRCSGNIVPFENTFPKNTDLYKLMTTKPGES